MSNGGEPIDKWTNSVQLATANDSYNLTLLSNAWADYYKVHHTYPSVWVVVGNTIYYGGY